MSVVLHSELQVVSAAEATQLWQAVVAYEGVEDASVGVTLVDEVTITQLNDRYRGKSAPTNVLTFSYGDEHDIAICGEVAKREAAAHKVALRDYMALLLTHAFLHVAGVDHEESEVVQARMEQAERKIMNEVGFAELTLFTNGD